MATTTLPFEGEFEALAPRIERGFLSAELICAVENIRTMNDLLATEHRHGDGFSPQMAEGVHALILHQTKIVAAVTHCLSAWEDEFRTEAAAEAAERNGVAESVRRVREAFIGEAAKAGAEPQIIAQALNVKRSSVERVIGALRGADPVGSEAAHAASA